MSAIGFTAKLEGTRSHLYDGGKLSVNLKSSSKVDAKLEPDYTPGDMDHFRVWKLGGKSVLMERYPSDAYSYWQARKAL